MKKLLILTGESHSDIARTMYPEVNRTWAYPEEKRSPLEAVKFCKEILEKLPEDRLQIVITMDPDCVSALRYIGEKMGIETEFLFREPGDNIIPTNLGNNIDPIFESFNKAIDFISENSI